MSAIATTSSDTSKQTSNNASKAKTQTLINAVKQGSWVKEEKPSNWYGRNVRVHIVTASFVQEQKLEQYLPKDIPSASSEAGQWWKGVWGDVKLLARDGRDLCQFLHSAVRYDRIQMEPAVLTPSMQDSVSFWLAKDPRTNQALLKEHRNDLEGPFNHGKEESTLVRGLRAFFGDKVDLDDSVVTCHPERSKIYRAFLAKHFSKTAIEKHQETLVKLIDERTKSWATRSLSEGSIDLIAECGALAGEALVRVMFGEGLKDPVKVAEASTTFMDYLIKFTLKGKLEATPEEDAAMKTLHGAMEEAFARKDCEFVKDLLANPDINERQAKIMTLLVIFAGKDNVTTLMSHVLLNLLQNDKLRQEFRSAVRTGTASVKRDTLRRFQLESLRMASGGYALGRRIHQRIYVIHQDRDNGQKLLQAIDPVGKTNIDICPHAAGRNPHIFKRANEYDPNREEIKKVIAKVKPFGGGQHRCPAEHWSLYFTQLFQDRLWSQYEVEPVDCKWPELVGGVTLQLRGKLSAKIGFLV